MSARTLLVQCVHLGRILAGYEVMGFLVDRLRLTESTRRIRKSEEGWNDGQIDLDGERQ